MAEKQAARPTWRPADRSVPLVIRHPETPQAMMKRGATFSSRFLPFFSVKKFWVVQPTKRASKMIRIMIALLDRNFLKSNFFSIFGSPPYSNWVASVMMFS